MNEDNECCICHISGAGVHNQISSCRGCAGFFKRSVIGKQAYICKRGKDTKTRCTINRVNQKRVCKQCRFLKCKEFGMVLKEAALKKCGLLGDEEAKETETKSNTPVIHNFLHTIISNIKDPKENAANLLSSSDVISAFKMEKVVVSAVKAKLFKSDLNKQNLNFFDLTMLQRGCIALTYFAHICDIKEPSDLRINTSTTFERLKKFKNQMYLNYASLLLIIPEYSSLCNEEKLYLYRTFWPCFSLFSNVILTLHLFGEKSQNLYFIADEDTILDINSDEVKNLTFLEGMSKECRDLVKTSFDYLINNILKPIKEMDLDNTECAYITFQILWSPKTVSGLSEPTKALSKSILQQIATELHHHYISFKKLDNYIFRLTEITKLINAAIEQCLICKNEIMIGKMFGFLESLYDDSQISSLI